MIQGERHECPKCHKSFVQGFMVTNITTSSYVASLRPERDGTIAIEAEHHIDSEVPEEQWRAICLFCGASLKRALKNLGIV